MTEPNALARLAQRMATLASALLVLIGASAAAGWIAGIAPLVRPTPGVAAMQITTAADMVLAGIAILCLNTRRCTAAAWAGAAITALAVAEEWTRFSRGWAGQRASWIASLNWPDIGVPVAPMSPATAAGFAMIGVALSAGYVAPTWRPAKAMMATLAACVLALGGLGLIGHLAGLAVFLSWYALSGMAIHTAAGLTLAGAAVLVLAIEPGWRRARMLPRWIPLPVTAGVVTVVVVLTLSLRERESAHTQLMLTQAAGVLSREVHQSAESLVRAIERVANRASTHPTDYSEEWMTDTRAYLRDFAALRSLVWVDADGAVRGMTAQGKPGGESASRPSDLLAAVSTLPRITRAATALFQRGGIRAGRGGPRSVLVVIVPTSAKGAINGAILGEIDLSDLLMEQVASGLAWNVDAELRANGRSIASTGLSAPPGGGTRVAVAAFRLRDVELELSVTPGAALAAGVETALPNFALAAGLAVSLLLGISLFYALQVRDSSRGLDAANRALEFDIRSRRRAERELLELNDGLERKVEERAGELRRTVRALTESEQRVRNVVESAPNALLMADRLGRITLVNRGVEDLFGYSRDELIGSDIAALLPVRLRGAHNAHVSNYFEHPQARAMGAGRDLFGLRKDGREIPLEIGLSPVTTREGIFALASIVDISERLQAETQFRSIVESSPNALLVADRAGQITLVSRNLELLFGYVREELIGRSVEMLIPERLRAGHARRVMAFFDNPVLRPMGSNLTLYGLQRSGKEIRIELGLSPVETTGGLFALASIMDISERVEGERLLRESQRLLSTVFETLPVRLSVKDKQGRFLLVNREMAAQDQQDASWYIGKTIDDLPNLTGEQKQKRWAGDLLVLQTGEVLRDPEFAMTLADGTPHIFESVRVPLKDEAGQTTGLVAIANDVTEQRALRDQVQATQRLETVGRLAGGMAHDFNNILAVIMNYAQFLSEDHAGNHPAQEDAKQIVRAAERGAALIRQLLAFSRKQVQRLDLLDLNEVIANMAPMLRRLMGEDIALHVKAGPELGRVMADNSQIEQVLMNLVVNARDAMPQGGTVTIETANTELDREYSKLKSGTAPGSYVQLAVSDTGIGMSEDVKSRIFEPFFTTKEIGKGTGLGLATVYGIVKQTGGQIWVYSEPGKGTTFRIYLPITAGQAAITVDSSLAPAPGGTETILLVEDEMMVRHVARRILEGAGYRVIDAGDGDEAIACAGQEINGIDLLLTDVVMPRMSGRQLSDRLREHRPDLRVLYMSGYTENAIVHHGVLEQNVLLVQKPFTREALLQMVRTALQTHSA